MIMAHLLAITIGAALLSPVTQASQPGAEAVPAQIVDSQEDKVFLKIRNLRPKADDLVTMYERMDGAPETTSRWRPLTSSKGEVQKEIDRLAESVEEVLLEGSYFSFINDARSGEERIRALENEIAEYKVHRLAAPDERHRFDPFTVTKSIIDDRIREREMEISAISEQIKANRSDFSKVLVERYGIRLSDNQLQQLMGRVDGQYSIKAYAVLGAVAEILRGLQVAIETSGGSHDVALRYYKIDTLGRAAVVSLWQRHYRKYDEAWFPELDRIESETLALLQENQDALKSSRDPKLRSIYQSNVSRCDLTISTLRDYRQLLVNQQRHVRIHLRKAQENLDASRLTYRTNKTTGDLLALIQSSQEEFNGLSAIQLPELLVFESSEAEMEFQKISERLR